MFKNYILIALRGMKRNKGYTFINVFGLAVGLAATFLIVLFVTDELSYDRYHENSDNIYRVSRAWMNEDGETSLHLGHVAPPFGPFLKSDFDGTILNAVRFMNDEPLMINGETKIEENRVFFVESDVFSVFSWELLEGNPETALVEPASIVLTESTAKKYFGDGDAMGQILNYNNLMEVKVTGIAKDIPHNSHFIWDMLVSFKTVEDFFGRENMMQNWGSNNYSTFLLLPEGYNPDELKAQFPAFLDRHMPEGNRPPSDRTRLELWPLTSIHLTSNLDSEIEANGNITYVYIYSVIALFILVIACINFMNLATARSIKRAREVGLRKVLGAVRTALIRQFIIESVIFSILGMLVAIGIVQLILPSFNTFVGKSLAISFGNTGVTLLVIFGITLVVGLLAGSYPAFYLSRFQPASILKGAGKSTSSKFNLRSVLVVIQFSISITLIIGVGIIQEQIEFMKAKDLGFDQSNIVVLPANDDIHNNFEDIRSRLESQPGIISATLSSRMPSGRLLDSQGTTAEVDGEMKMISFRVADIHVSHDYLPELGVQMSAGRNFDENRASDSLEAFVLNEAAVKAIGWESPEAAIDKKFNYGSRTGQIIGVVEDFHFESLHQEIAPIVFLVTTGRTNNVAIRLADGRNEEALAYLEEQWTFLRPGFPFSYYYVEDAMAGNYQNEENLDTLVSLFSILAIVIASMGLFGLSSFISELRIREIGIRKVLGATVTEILLMLTRGFTVLVGIAFILSVPISYTIMDRWLGNFAYAEAISVWPFAMALGFALAIAWVTISFQTLRAAKSNPVDVLHGD